MLEALPGQRFLRLSSTSPWPSRIVFFLADARRDGHQLLRPSFHGTRPYFANLTRRGRENDSFNAFTQLVRPEFRGQIIHLSWEDLFVIAGLAGGKLCLLPVEATRNHFLEMLTT
jgi:hypothetical protein